MQTYRIGFVSSVSLHLLLLLFFSVSLSTQSKVYVTKKPKTEIVKAVSIDSQKVLAEVERIKKRQQQQELTQQKRQQRLKRQAQQAKQRRLKEQQRLRRIKQQARELAKKQKRQRLLEQKRLAKLQKQKEQQQQELARIEKQKKLEQKSIDEIKRKQRLAEQKRRQQQQMEEQKQQRLARQKAELAKKAQLMGEVNKYKALIINAISQNWILPDNVDKSLSSKFEIRLAPGGSVISVKLLRSSGDPVLDRSAQTAIYRASPLPVPSAPDAFKLFRVVSLTVKPENIIDNNS